MCTIWINFYRINHTIHQGSSIKVKKHIQYSVYRAKRSRFPVKKNISPSIPLSKTLYRLQSIVTNLNKLGNQKIVKIRIIITQPKFFHKSFTCNKSKDCNSLGQECKRAGPSFRVFELDPSKIKSDLRANRAQIFELELDQYLRTRLWFEYQTNLYNIGKSIDSS